MSTHVSPEKILQIGLGFGPSKALLSAVELGLFTFLNQGPKDAETIRVELALHPRGTVDFLDLLVALGFLNRQNGLYSNTEETGTFLVRGKPAYVGGLLEMANVRLYPFWGALTTALKTGLPQNEAAGGDDIFAELYADPARLEGFLKAMTGVSLGSALAIAAKFPWDKYQTFCDVGTAQGIVPVQVALANRHLTGGGFDLPQVQPIAEAFFAEHGLSERLTFQSGDFFTQPLPQADVLIMGHILHDWDLDQKRMLVKKAYEALPEGGALIVYDAMIDDDRRENVAGLFMSLNMLIETPGGFDYTGADCVSWMWEAGFKSANQQHLAGPESMVVGIK